MNNFPFLIIDGLKLVLTCQACPEQYDVYFGDTQVGYLRLRHGEFSASYPDYGGDQVFYTSPKGDGCFEDHERFTYLKKACAALIKAHNDKVVSEDL